MCAVVIACLFMGRAERPGAARMTVTIDLCADDDDDDERVGPAAASAIVNRQSVAKRKEHPTTGASRFADDDDNEDNGADSEVEATFSEGEQDEDEGRKIADTADADGYDFSGTCVADAAQSECPLCDAPFQVTWDAEFSLSSTQGPSCSDTRSFTLIASRGDGVRQTRPLAVGGRLHRRRTADGSLSRCNVQPYGCSPVAVHTSRTKHGERVGCA